MADDDDIEPFVDAQFAAEYATPEGRAVWRLLNRADVVARMETATDLGRPALEAVEDILLAALGEAMLADRLKQMTGRMVRQIMERQGYVHDAYDIRVSSVPFYKMSRYRRGDADGVFLFRNSSDPRDICLTYERDGPRPQLDKGQWRFVNRVTSPLKALIGYSFDLKATVAEAKRDGHARRQVQRMFRGAPR